MLLLVGLGNPGERHARNRHNIGFMAVDRVAETHGFSTWRSRFQGLVAEGRVAGDKVLALKPLTYMNESGRSVGEAMRFYKLDLADVLVCYDEIDLAPGKVRVKTGGGAAGHNGIRSIAAHIGPDFRRVRLGVGHPGRKDKVHGHVLSDFAKADRELLERELDAVTDAFPLLVEGRDSDFMSQVAAAINPPRKGPPKPPDTPDSPGDTTEDGPAKTALGAALGRALGSLRRP